MDNQSAGGDIDNTLFKTSSLEKFGIKDKEGGILTMRFFIGLLSVHQLFLGNRNADA
jgi:hypothetical protein